MLHHSTTPFSMTAKLQSSLAKLRHWVEAHDYKAYDPGDGNSSFLHALTFNNLLLERLLQQAVYRAPFNLRPWIGIHPHTSTKGMGYMAWGYTRLFGLTRDAGCKERAEFCLQWLTKNRSPGYADCCWGNHFPFSSRAGKIPALEPTIVWSSLIGQAFLAAYEALSEPRYLDAASSICQWILKLPREKTDSGDCLSYVAFEQSSIHNSNMLGAALLAKVGSIMGDSEPLDVAKKAMAYSCSRQNADGAWFYGGAPKYHWIDNFHTGYNLDSLRRYQESSGDKSFDDQLRRGFVYFKAHFFEPTGRPKYYHNQVYPIDIQCAAQAIDTLSFFSDRDAEALALAQKVAGWTIDHMQAADGHFYYRDLGWAVNKTPMLHWGQGTMFKALAHLLSKLERPAQRRNDRREEAMA
jgi:rhamnogalacturonyl hydrolase YesR